MKDYLKYLLLLLSFTTLQNCRQEKSTISDDKVEISFKKEGTLRLIKGKSDAIIKTIDIEIADNEYETQTGLMYRTSLGKTQGMLFIFPDVDYRIFYMKNTKIPLDIIYINENKEVVSFQKNAKPFDETSLPSNALAKYVLEINAGLSDEWNIEVSDRIEFDFLNE